MTRTVHTLALLCLIALASCRKQMGNKDKGGEIDIGSKMGEEMVTFVKKDGDDEKEMKIGIAKVVEVDGSGKMVNITGHYCDLRQLNDTGKAISCSAGDPVNKTYAGEDSDGNAITMKFQVVTLTCDLSTCNAANAKIMIHMMRVQGSGFICQPNCTAEDKLMSPVEDGSLKMELELDSWNFCKSTDASCKKNDEQMVGAGLNVYFAVGGKSKKKGDMKPKRRQNKEFNPSEKEEKKCEKKYGKRPDGGNGTKPDGGNGTKPDGGKRPDGGNGTKPDGGNGTKPDGGKRPDGGNGTKPDGGNGTRPDGGNGTRPNGGKRKPTQLMSGNRGRPPKCRKSRNMRNNIPDDQDAVQYGDEEDNIDFRLFNVAYKIGNDGEKTEEEVEIEVQEDKRNPKKGLVCVKFPMFEKKMFYDPTASVGKVTGNAFTTALSTTLLSLVLVLYLA